MKSRKLLVQLSLGLVLGAGITFSAGAGPLEDAVDRIENKVNNINNRTSNMQGKLNDLFGTAVDSAGIDIDEGTKQQILDGLSELKVVLAKAKAETDDFGDGSFGDGCYDFRESMKGLITNMTSIVLQLQSVGSLDAVDLSDLGDLSVIDQIPCAALIGISFAFENTPLEELSVRLTNIAESLEVVTMLLVEPEFQPSSSDAETRSTLRVELAQPEAFGRLLPLNENLYHTRTCEHISTPKARRLIGAASAKLKIDSIILQITAAKVDTEVFAGISQVRKLAPVSREASGGAWGFAEVTIERQDGGHKFAQGLLVVAKILDAVTEAASTKVFRCTVTHNHQVLLNEMCAISRYRSPACQAIQ